MDRVTRSKAGEQDQHRGSSKANTKSAGDGSTSSKPSSAPKVLDSITQEFDCPTADVSKKVSAAQKVKPTSASKKKKQENQERVASECTCALNLCPKSYHEDSSPQESIGDDG